MRPGACPALLLVIPIALLLLVVPATGRADGGGGGGGGGGDPTFAPPKDPNYTRAWALIEDGKYEQAIPLLERVIARDGRDADAFNLLGYSTRKLGRPEASLPFYRKALEIDPGHRGAHEYIGEAYLELGRLDKAKEHLAFLDADCWFPCSEYSDLKAAVARYESNRGR